MEEEKVLDKTKGIVKEEKKVKEISNDEVVVLEMENGRLQMYGDYTKLDKKKFPRLTR